MFNNLPSASRPCFAKALTKQKLYEKMTGVLFTCSASSSGHSGYPSSQTLSRNSRDAVGVTKPLHISLGGVWLQVKPVWK